MRSITIHKLDEQLDALIRKKAKREGSSLNKTIQKLLRQALGLSQSQKVNNRDDFLDLFGVWSKKDENDFKKRISDLNEIDLREWQ